MKIMFKPFLMLILSMILVSMVYGADNGSASMIKIQSSYDYQQTRARLIQSVTDNKLVLFGEFNHAEAAQRVHLFIPPTTVIIFGNPKGGTKLMLRYPQLALDLPFRVLISERQDGQVIVSYHPAESLQSYGLDSIEIQNLKKLEQLVQDSIK